MSNVYVVCRETKKRLGNDVIVIVISSEIITLKMKQLCVIDPSSTNVC